MLRPYICRNNQGSIFILTLWSLCLLSILAIGLGGIVGQDISVATYFQDQPAARYLARAAIKRAQAIIKNEPSSYLALNGFWSTGRYADNQESVFKEAKLGKGFYCIINRSGEAGLTTRYGLIDEERKININKAGPGVLERLFIRAGEMEIDQARILAGAIIDWRDTDLLTSEGAAEDDFYNNLTRPYRCKNKNIQVLEELHLVRGMTDEVFLKIKDLVTVFGDGKVNINTADRPVLYALGLDDSLINKIIIYRNGEDGLEATSDDQVLMNSANLANDLKAGAGLSDGEYNKIVELIANGWLNVNSRNFLVPAEGQIGRRMVAIACVTDRSGRIKYWRE